MFFKGSRYTDVADSTLTDSQGRTVRYMKRRFIPETKALMGHMVTQGERPDHIADRYYRDAERFWRLCDANLTMWPDDLVAEPGETILLPPGQG